MVDTSTYWYHDSITYKNNDSKTLLYRSIEPLVNTSIFLNKLTFNLSMIPAGLTLRARNMKITLIYKHVPTGKQYLLPST